MDSAEFERWISRIVLLSPAQRSIAFRDLALAAATDAADGLASDPGWTGERSENAGPFEVASSEPANGSVERDLFSKIGRDRLTSYGCPHCGSDAVTSWGKASGKPRYRCTNCRKTFNPLTGTPLARLRHRHRWSDQAQALMCGETIVKAAARADVHYTTAFRWRHRFLAALNFDHPQRLTGIVEADETFILESFKGKRRGLPRAPRKRGGKSSKRGLSTEQIPIIVARDRTGATTDAVLPHLNAANIKAAIGKVIDPSAKFCCDGGTAITAFARRAGVKVHVLAAPGIPKPNAPEIHINNVNAYHGRLKEWMHRFHGVATKNLPNYLSWRRTIEAFGSTATPQAWIAAAAGLGPYQQATL